MASQQVSESNQNKPITHDELQVEDPYTPSYAQYQANKKFSDDVVIRLNMREVESEAGRAWLLMKTKHITNIKRVIKEYKQLQP